MAGFYPNLGNIRRTKNSRDEHVEIEREAREQIMSVQFGRWNFEGQPLAPGYIERVSAALAPYGPDSNESYSKVGIRILYRAFHTTKESRREKQPCISPSGAVITWDGRLDNRADLISELRDSLTVDSTDVAIVAAAYEKWGANCLGKLIGDWALSIWNPKDYSLLLAKDPVGTRQLYYTTEKDQVTWSTILDPLVLFAGKTFQICEEYVASWLATALPVAHLTPYLGINTVPPSSSVLLRAGRYGARDIITKYWDFDSGKRIRYRTDAEYEEHFRVVFSEAVQRRLRCDGPVLAELSGGMDSSSIVCIADLVLAQGQNAASHPNITPGSNLTPRMDTISWYDASNPGMDEYPYLTKVEQKRGRMGYHIDFGALRQRNETRVSSQTSLASGFAQNGLVATPFTINRSDSFFRQYTTHMRSMGYRVVLVGVAGDEVMGSGVPTPTPELQNLLAKGRFFTLAQQLKAWAVKMRKPRLPLLWEAVLGFFASSSARLHPSEDTRLASWLHPDFVRRNNAAVRGDLFRVKLFGPLPSFQSQVATLNFLRKIPAFHVPPSDILFERRFPYLDRSLLEFMYAIPRELIVRVGQRRFLMKRALVGIVPDEILNRRQRTYIAPELDKDRSAEWPSLAVIGQHIVGSAVGVIDASRFLEVLQKARRNEDVPIELLSRTLTLEYWLRHLAIQGVLTTSTVHKPTRIFRFIPSSRAEVHRKRGTSSSRPSVLGPQAPGQVGQSSAS
jgi:asparagine synthase (glutamine-hydrolysing)